MQVRGRDYEYGDELPVIHGHADAVGLPFGLLEAEAQQLKDELDAALARKKPPGFAPWPADSDT